ncbi:MAG: hypothetical protein ACYC3B_01630 [Sedimentisphaerales bacterium]
MAKGTLRDSVLNDARNKALGMSHLPESIKAAFKVSYSSGQVVLTPKSAGERKKSRLAK